MLTENEYAKHKHKLYAYWRNRKIKQAISAYTDFLGRSLNISFHENTLQRFFEAFEENPEEEGLETSGKFDFLDDAILFDSEIGNWTVADFRNYARFTAIEHQKFIKNIERFKEFITGLAVRQKILSLAKESNLHKSPEYEKQVAEKKDIYLLTRFEKQIASEMVIPEDSLHAYYERNQEIFAEPAKVNLREIVLNSQEAAKNVGRKLDNGESFPELALKYSERKWTAERGGELGYLAAQDFGKWSDLAFSMEPGERKGPVEIDSAYVFLQCIDKVPAKPRSFEAARDDVVEAVRFALKDDYRANRIQEFRQNIDVTVMTSKLKQLNIY